MSQCTCILASGPRKGAQCSNQAKPGSNFCGVHKTCKKAIEIPQDRQGAQRQRVESHPDVDKFPCLDDTLYLMHSTTLKNLIGILHSGYIYPSGSKHCGAGCATSDEGECAPGVYMSLVTRHHLEDAIDFNSEFNEQDDDGFPLPFVKIILSLRILEAQSDFYLNSGWEWGKRATPYVPQSNQFGQGPEARSFTRQTIEYYKLKSKQPLINEVIFPKKVSIKYMRQMLVNTGPVIRAYYTWHHHRLQNICATSVELASRKYDDQEFEDTAYPTKESCLQRRQVIIPTVNNMKYITDKLIANGLSVYVKFITPMVKYPEIVYCD